MTGHAHSDSVSKTAVQRARVRVCWKQEEDLTGHLVHQKPSVSFRHQLKLKSNQSCRQLINSHFIYVNYFLKLFLIYYYYFIIFVLIIFFKLLLL